MPFSLKTRGHTFFIAIKNDTLTWLDQGPSWLYMRPLALLFWLTLSSHWELFFFIRSIFCLVFDLLPHCNNKPFISNKYQTSRPVPRDKRHIVVRDMSSRAGVFITMNRFSDILLMLHRADAKGHCFHRVGVEGQWGNVPTCLFVTKCFPCRTHQSSCVSASVVANTEPLVGFSMLHIHTVRLSVYQLDTVSDMQTEGKPET